MAKRKQGVTPASFLEQLEHELLQDPSLIEANDRASGIILGTAPRRLETVEHGLPGHRVPAQGKRTGKPILLLHGHCPSLVTLESYDHRLSDDPDVNNVMRFLREREVVHFQRFGEALRLATEKQDSRNIYAFNPAFDR